MGMLSNYSKGPVIQISDEIVNNRSLRPDLANSRKTRRTTLSIF